MREENKDLASQLAQRAVLYAAHERRAAAEQRDVERVNTATIREAAKFEGEIASLREQIGRIEQQLREPNNKAALCEQRSEEAEASRRDAAQRADEAERSLLQAVSQGVALQEEVRGSSVKHSIIRSFIQPFIHSFVRSFRHLAQF